MTRSAASLHPSARGPSGAGRIRRYLIGQFMKPRGLSDAWPAGLWQTAAPTDGEMPGRSDLMDLASTDRVLEVGYGPGLALESVLPRIPDGQVVGLDHSVTMRHAAAARNRGAVADGRLTLRVGEVENLASSDDPILAGPFDRIFAVNVAMFWKNQEQVFGLLAGRLATGGRIFITVQPRTGERTDEAARAAAEKLAASMGAAGLANIRIETLPELSPMAVCVVGGKQPPDAGQTLNLNSITSPSWTT